MLLWSILSSIGWWAQKAQSKQISCEVHSAVELPDNGHISGRNMLEYTL